MSSFFGQNTWCYKCYRSSGGFERTQPLNNETKKQEKTNEEGPFLKRFKLAL